MSQFCVNANSKLTVSDQLLIDFLSMKIVTMIIFFCVFCVWLNFLIHQCFYPRLNYDLIMMSLHVVNSVRGIPQPGCANNNILLFSALMKDLHYANIKTINTMLIKGISMKKNCVYGLV